MIGVPNQDDYEEGELKPLLEVLHEDINSRTSRQYHVLAGSKAAIDFVKPTLNEIRAASLDKVVPELMPQPPPELAELPEGFENIQSTSVERNLPAHAACV